MIYALIAAVLVAVDQLVKYLVMTRIPLGEHVPFIPYILELTYVERKRVHNLKYYTWVEQQARDVQDLNDLWYDTEGTWDAVHQQAAELDELINEFNEATGLLKNL